MQRIACIIHQFLSSNAALPALPIHKPTWVLNSDMKNKQKQKFCCQIGIADMFSHITKTADFEQQALALACTHVPLAAAMCTVKPVSSKQKKTNKCKYHV